MKRKAAFKTGLTAVMIHHSLAAVIILCGRYAIGEPITSVLFQALFIVNLVPITLSAILAAPIVEKLIASKDIIVRVMFSSIALFSTLQWFVIGSLVGRIIEHLRRRN